ncbi:unnamed protein product [Ambrosiozyma monospora]|uniref:Unnamed protein product n=1 Tax=Ambrosiozyma monospora TaxID=43982 RepID=A0ACB5SRM4_AMBMO|nr:unnamed protein product [Ambrosiozyma monospora]
MTLSLLNNCSVLSDFQLQVQILAIMMIGSAWHFMSNLTSDDQIHQLDRLCKETTEKLKLRRDLIISGITDVDKQNAIIDTAMEKKNTYELSPLEEESDNQKVTKFYSNIDDHVYNFTSATLTKDSKFLMESTTTESLDLKLNSVKLKFLNYLKTWKSIFKERQKNGLVNNNMIPKQLYSEVRSLVGLQLSSPGEVFAVGCNGVGLGGVDLFQDGEIRLGIDECENGNDFDDSDGEN